MDLKRAARPAAKASHTSHPQVSRAALVQRKHAKAGQTVRKAEVDLEHVGHDHHR